LHWETSKNNPHGAKQNQPDQHSPKPDCSFIRRFVQLLLAGTGLLLLVLLGCGAWLWVYAHKPTSAAAETTVLIPRGAGVRQIEAILRDNGVIRHDVPFLILARVTGTAGRLRAGEYRIAARQTPLQTLRQLAEGKVIRHRVTIPEGKTIRQITEILTAGKWINPARFIALTHDPEFIKKLGFNLDSLEGYLFPDTYTLTRDTVTEEGLVAMMTKRFLEIWRTIAPVLPEGLTRQQVIILASIVEKETGKPDERPLIAKVFLNRLERNMRLQADPTVIYGLDDFDGDLTRGDLQMETPYNTYVIQGLPPGPVCNPGRDSIQAVLHPADVPYLYFVAKNDGTHHFSRNLRDHNVAVRKYQRSPPVSSETEKKR